MPGSRFGRGRPGVVLLTLVRGFVGDGLKAISAVEGQEQIVCEPGCSGQGP